MATKLLKRNDDFAQRRKMHKAWVASLPAYTPGMVVRCPKHNSDGSPIDDDDVKGCGSANVVWDGFECYDCLDCGIFFSPYAADPIHQRNRDQGTYKTGSRIIYDDGRPGHRVQATVLSVDDRRMVVQFDDRADTTTIAFSDDAWMKHIKSA